MLLRDAPIAVFWPILIIDFFYTKSYLKFFFFHFEPVELPFTAVFKLSKEQRSIGEQKWRNDLKVPQAPKTLPFHKRLLK